MLCCNFCGDLIFISTSNTAFPDSPFTTIQNIKYQTEKLAPTLFTFLLALKMLPCYNKG
jgi:hypothetical protein